MLPSFLSSSIDDIRYRLDELRSIRLTLTAPFFPSCLDIGLFACGLHGRRFTSCLKMAYAFGRILCI
jgi:hypothetical protein